MTNSTLQTPKIELTLSELLLLNIHLVKFSKKSNLAIRTEIFLTRCSVFSKRKENFVIKRSKTSKDIIERFKRDLINNHYFNDSNLENLILRIEKQLNDV